MKAVVGSSLVTRVLALSFLALSGCAAQAEPSSGEGVVDEAASLGSSTQEIVGSWNLVWSDEFDGNSLDRGNWTVLNLPAGSFNGEWQRYDDDETGANNTFDVSGGNLNIRVRYAGGGFGGYRSARLTSKNKIEKAQGAWEARLWIWKSNGVRGLWPAWWMLGDRLNQAPLSDPNENLCWPKYQANEIDIAESTVNTNTNQGNFIKDWGGGCEVYDSRNLVTDLNTNAFAPHVYRLEWLNDSLRLMVDGDVKRTIPESDWRNVWDNRYFTIINAALGGSLGGDVAFGPSDYAGISVDYVRYYEHQSKVGFPDPAATYKISSAFDGYVLTAKDAGGNDNRITMATDGDMQAQRWKFVDAGGGYYYMKSAWSNKVIEMKDENGVTGPPPFNATMSVNGQRNAQKFNPIVDANGRYAFQSANGENLAGKNDAGGDANEFRRAAAYAPGGAAIQKFVVDDAW